MVDANFQGGGVFSCAQRCNVSEVLAQFSHFLYRVHVKSQMGSAEFWTISLEVNRNN